MKTTPLPYLSLKEAAAFQFRLVDSITRHFNGEELLSQGGLGLAPGIGKPQATRRTEETLADFFESEDAVLVRGAGTGAIRSALTACFKNRDRLLVHTAPVYPTTLAACVMMGLTLVETDFNHETNAASYYAATDVQGALVQVSRQKPDDSYDYTRLIAGLKAAAPELPIITDDNYAVMKVQRVGSQCGADLSCFSLFKLLGPEGIGCVLGKGALIERIAKANYSGGGQVQGHEALNALRSLVYAPTALALQAKVCAEVELRLKAGELPQVRNAVIANAQSRIIIVEFEQPIAKNVLAKAALLGAAPYPVGSESRYEVAPLFYRLSGTFLESDPTMGDRMIRINPMRAGADTIISILRRALEER
ncbi:MAG: aminotransferase class V-fold PLP-dependent enzyme [Treponema sp.]|jgi:hypothetical protein|nr:aminotransferase class V-fold PLP-dependent enzyme [Treponema sp.]